MMAVRVHPSLRLISIAVLATVSIALHGCVEGGTSEPRSSVGVDTALPVDPASADESPGETVALAAALATGEEEALRRVTIETHLVVEEDVLIPSRMSGIVQAIFADRGSRVRKGQLLLTLMNHDLELRVKRAEIDRRKAAAEHRRAKRLFEQRALSRSDYETAEIDFEGVSVDLDIAHEELEKSLVRAPFDGLIIERYAKVGQKVLEEENTPLFRLSALGPLHARLYLTEDVARLLAQGDEARIVPRFIPGHAVTGRVDWISPVIDASSGTSLAIIGLPPGGRANPGLLPGTAVSVTLDVPLAFGRPRGAVSIGEEPTAETPSPAGAASAGTNAPASGEGR